MSADEHQPGIREALADRRMSAFLAKPLNLDHLVEAIRRAADG
ncbi:MAG TPA: hypothetical protein VFH48_33225 [Chloroflexota bacterium]|nr:hypothetical protein [Chloroflexota bacterium]